MEPNAPENPSSTTAGIIINKQDVHISELKPTATKKLQGYKSPGGDSTSYLIETPKNPTNSNDSRQKPLATSEIMLTHSLLDSVYHLTITTKHPLPVSNVLLVSGVCWVLGFVVKQ